MSLLVRRSEPVLPASNMGSIIVSSQTALLKGEAAGAWNIEGGVDAIGDKAVVMDSCGSGLDESCSES